MRLLQCAVLGCLAVAFAAASLPADEKDAKIDNKIVGVWKVKRLVPGFPPAEKCEFTSDGKVKLSRKLTLKLDLGGKDVQLESIVQLGPPGAYEITGDTLKITFKEIGKDKKDFVHTTTITKLSDKELHTKDKKGEINQFEKN